MATIESNDETVADVLKSFYVVPDYQREYVWEESQVEQLLRDIRTEQLEGADTEYFIGSIVVCPRPDGAFDLIDGQQRTTTLFVTLCAIRDRLATLGETQVASISKLIADTAVDAEGNDVFRARLDPQYSDAGDLFQKLQDGEEPPIAGTRSMRNVAIAYATALRFLEEELGADPQAVRKFYGYLAGKVKLIRIRTDSLARALKIFETINDRGVGLDAMDLLKNLLFIRAAPAEFERLKDRWKALTNALYNAGEKPLRFLRYYIFATYGATKLREDELYTWLSANDAKIGYGKDPLGFVDRLADALATYLHFLDGLGADGKPHPRVQAISLLAGRATRQHLILLLAARKHPTDIFDELCRDIESLLVTYLVTRTTSREFEALFPEWAVRIAAVASVEEYRAFASATLVARRRDLAARFHREMASLNGASLRQYQLRYMLAKLTQHVDLLAYGAESEGCRWLSRYTDGSNVHIEHILPQTPDDSVRMEFGEGADDYDLLWSIGNLALAERSINSWLGRRPFSEKRPVYPKSQLLLTRAIAEQPGIGNTAIDRAVAAMKPFETWSRGDIIQRSRWLADLAMEVWDLPMLPPTSAA
jgi:hypothetical protein